ncbi:MAG: hypothetical protein DMD26_14840 [Gemmatimonadetes bacterium]|nr:MAG: hypothetical protein DMD26_14840 [Gemmatimonadota bacterium]
MVTTGAELVWRHSDQQRQTLRGKAVFVAKLSEKRCGAIVLLDRWHSKLGVWRSILLQASCTAAPLTEHG